jgi:hypothetical protein
VKEMARLVQVHRPAIPYMCTGDKGKGGGGLLYLGGGYTGRFWFSVQRVATGNAAFVDGGLPASTLTLGWCVVDDLPQETVELPFSCKIRIVTVNGTRAHVLLTAHCLRWAVVNAAPTLDQGARMARRICGRRSISCAHWRPVVFRSSPCTGAHAGKQADDTHPLQPVGSPARVALRIPIGTVGLALQSCAGTSG